LIIYIYSSQKNKHRQLDCWLFGYLYSSYRCLLIFNSIDMNL